MIVNSSAVIPVDALVFDAYGTLFDVQSVVTLAERLFPGHGSACRSCGAAKQLEYSWLQSLMLSPTQRREDFAALTAHALDYAVKALGLSPQMAVRHRLLDAYLDLSPFPDVAPALARSARCRADPVQRHAGNARAPGGVDRRGAPSRRHSFR